MKVEKMAVQGQRVKRCSDRRIAFIFDALDKHLQSGESPGAAWQLALEDYAKHYVNRSR